MSVQLEARFDSDGKANLAVEQLRQSGILFELLELKPTRSRWKGEGEQHNRTLNAAFPPMPEIYMSTNPTGMPFENLYTRAFMASNSLQVPASKNDAEIQLRISVTEKSLGKAEKIIRGTHGYGMKVHR